MLTQAVIATLNHLLAESAWARDRLRPFASRVALLSASPLAFRLAIDADGYFAEPATDTPVDAEVSVPASAFPFALHGVDAVARHVVVSGNAKFAETLGFVLRNLRWDVEEDLSRLFGDIAARRMTQGATQFVAWQKGAAHSLAASTADYLTEEAPLLVKPDGVGEFADTVDRLRDDLARLEKRVEKLERRTG